MRIVTPLFLALTVVLVPLTAYSRGGGGHSGDGGNSSITGATAGGGPVGGSTTGSIGTPIPSSATPPPSTPAYPPLANGNRGAGVVGTPTPNGVR
jgi:hypothetical protein